MEIEGDVIVKIKTKLHTILKKYIREKIMENDIVEIKENTTLQDLTRYFNIPENKGIIFLVNNSPQDKEYTLQEGDEVKLFSLICGG